MHGERRGIGGVDDEEGLDPGVGELVDLLVVVLPRVVAAVHSVLCDVDGREPEVFQPRKLDVRRKDRRPERDRVAVTKDPVLAQAAEHVTHGRRSTFDRKEVEYPRGRPVVAHRLGEVPLDDSLGVREDTIRLRVVVTDDCIGELVHEGVCVEAQGRRAVRE